MSIENEIEKLKRTRKHGPMPAQERWEVIQNAYKNGMRESDLLELDYSLMSADERDENDRIWADIRV